MSPEPQYGAAPASERTGGAVEPGRPHLRRSFWHHDSPHFFTAKWRCAALYGFAGYGVTKQDAYYDWQCRNLLHIDGPRHALRVFPSLRERRAVREGMRELRDFMRTIHG